MAIVNTPLLSEDARNKLGSLVFMGWRGANTVRIHSIPTQPRTVRQVKIRAELSAVMEYFKNITATQKASWQSLASLKKVRNMVGKVYALTAANLYAAYNILAVDMGGSISANPPTAAPAAAVASATSASATAGALTVTPTMSGTPSASDFLDLWIAGPFQSGRRNATHSEYRHNKYVAGNSTTVGTTGLTSGNFYWWKVRYISAAGQPTAYQEGQQQIT